MKLGTYKCVVPDRSVYGQHVSLECDHNHRTYSGARRCLENLSENHADGTGNLWAYSGTVWVYTEAGWTPPPTDTVISYQEQAIAKLCSSLTGGA